MLIQARADSLPRSPASVPLPPLQEFDDDEEEIEYLDEDELGFDPNEEGDMEDFSGSEEEGSDDDMEGSSGGAPGGAGGVGGGRRGGGEVLGCLCLFAGCARAASGDGQVLVVRA